MAINKLAELKQALGSAARASKYRVNFSVPAAIPTTSDLNKVDTLIVISPDNPSGSYTRRYCIH